MKKIIVTSDTHGKTETLYHILKERKDADMFIHLGDYVSDAERASQRLGIDVICVKANGDVGSQLPLSREISVEKTKILAVHGHLQRVKYSLLRLSFEAQESKADVVLFGHTHIPMVEKNGILYVNPGYGGAGHYAVLTINGIKAEAEIFKL